MRAKPRLLDLFCGAGGAGMGYSRAGFEVLGVDLAPQPRYPFTFWQDDALAVLRGLAESEVTRGILGSFDAIHASPPCQAHTTMSNRWRGAGGKADSHRDLIGEVRDRLECIGLPYVIENVPGARRQMRDPITLDGSMFGLRVRRPRLFESNVLLLSPPTREAVREPVGVYGKAHDGRLLYRRRDGTEQRAARSLEEAREAMGMPWADWRGCAEAIPPAYAEFIGAQLIRALAHPRAREFKEG